MRLIANIILRLFGWKMQGSIPADVRKAIVIMAPHTSMWDFVFGFLGFMSLGYRSRYLIKREMFFFPLGLLLNLLGGIPVNRQSAAKLVIQVSDLISTHDEIILTITPEGTRNLVKNWKKGYYFIAQHSNIPIYFGFLDYKKKLGGIGPGLKPSGDYNEDLKVIEDFYIDINARHPEKFSLSEQNRGK